MASNSKNLGELLNTTSTVSPAFVSDQDNTSTGYFDLPNGTTAQRPSAASGMIRYNSTSSLAEYYDGNAWKSIDSPPVISAVSPSAIANSSSSVDITISGDFFASGATVKAIGQDLSEIAATSVSFTNSTTLVATFNGTSFADAQEDYSIEVTNVSGLAGKGSDLLAVNASPAWTVASGSLGTIFDSARSGISITTGATDDEGASLTYSVSTGSLPSGLSIASATGTISGTLSAVGSDTTTSFTLSVTDGTNTTTRAYSITVKAPVVTSYTSTGSGTFSVPTGVSAVDVLVVAGAGGGGARGGGGGGAGGLIYRPAFPVTPGSTISTQVGTGGRRATMNNGTDSEGAVNGIDSIFGTLRAKGGGHGGNQTGSPVGPTPNGGAGTGGSGGGSHQNVYYNNNFANPMPNNATQPSQPGDSGSYGFGNQGGSNSSPSQDSYGALAGGGGGAGQAGTPGGTGDATMGKGGIGKQYDISGSQVYYAGGGGAGHHPGFPSQHSYSAGGNGGGGNGGSFPGQGAGGSSGQDGTANRGGGGGGCTTDGNSGVHYGGTGGTGVIIVKY